MIRRKKEPTGRHAHSYSRIWEDIARVNYYGPRQAIVPKHRRSDVEQVA